MNEHKTRENMAAHIKHSGLAPGAEIYNTIFDSVVCASETLASVSGDSNPMTKKCQHTQKESLKDKQDVNQLRAGALGESRRAKDSAMSTRTCRHRSTAPTKT
jgi:hypothetical protein